MEGRRENPDLEGEHHHQQQYEEMELSLGLSMNGRFGVDPTMNNKRLRRSSSTTANLVFAVGGVAGSGTCGRRAPAGVAVEFEARAPLWRTRSLPATEAEEEEEWRRRKELQSARKKRMEKMRNLRLLRDAAGSGNLILRRRENGDVTESSQRSGSAASSDLIEGLKPKQTAEVSPSSQTISHEQEPATIQTPVRDAEVPTIKSPKNPMLDMPLVTTKDPGPNGRKVEGFLYGFKKGQEVKIVCVCHGKFLTPKEFTEHGGGGVVEHPLKHIVVNPFPLL